MNNTKEMDKRLPFSLHCFLCAEERKKEFGKTPDCESMNATYTHSEKKEILLKRFPSVDISRLCKSISFATCLYS